MKFLTWRHHLQVILAAFRVFWQVQIAYRLGTVVWVLNGFITPTILTLVWLTVGQSRQIALSEQQIVTYYLLATIVTRLTQSWTGDNLGEKINRGMLSIHLVRPTNYVTFELARDLAAKAMRLLALMPFVVIAAFLLHNQIWISDKLLDWGLFVIAISGGYILNYLIQNLVGLAALWVEKSSGIYQIEDMLAALFNGYLIPMALMPIGLKQIALVLPFQFILSFPVQLAQGTLESLQIFSGFSLLLSWLVILIIVNVTVYQAGIKKYCAVGI